MKKTLSIKTSASLFTGLLVCLFACSLSAQDLHFSQYMQTPSLVNPALTGSSSVLRASVIYKDQWASITVPYKTFGASFEMKFNASSWENNRKNFTKKYKKAFRRLAGGLSFFSDKAGDGNMSTTQANLALAAFVPTNEESSLSLGLQASVVQRNIDFSKLVFSNQYSGAGYDPNITNGENFSSQSFIYPDFSGGINWSYGYNQSEIDVVNSFKAKTGISVYHFNKPEQKFLNGSNERLSMKYIIHGEVSLGITNTSLTIVPGYLMEFQKPATEILVGMMVKYYVKKDPKNQRLIKKSSFGLGAHYRNKDALIVSGLVEFGQYAIGCSYDLNTSKLSTVSKVHGGPEIFIRFVNTNPYLLRKKTTASFN